MARKRHTGAFIAGSLLGGVIGAALTLWKTPKSGPELRASWSGGGSEQPAATPAGTEEQTRFSNPVLSFIEKATAPIVGVELGKLARDDPDATATSPLRTSAADARPPVSTSGIYAPNMAGHDTAAATGAVDTPPAGVRPVAGEPARVPNGGQTASSASEAEPGQMAVNPEEEATHHADTGSDAHAATTEELTHPTPEYAEHLKEERAADTEHSEGNVDFPDPPAGARSNR